MNFVYVDLFFTPILPDYLLFIFWYIFVPFMTIMLHFFFFFFRKTNIFHELFLVVLLCYFDNIYLMNLQTFLQVNFIMNYIIHKISVLLKITRILKLFLRSMINFYFLKKIINFFHNI